MLIDIDDDSYSRIISLSNLEPKIKKIFGSGYLYLHKHPSNRIDSNTNDESIGIDFENTVLSYKNNSLFVRKIKCLNMNALKSWQKITWNSLSNIDIDESNIDTTWFQVSQPISFGLDYLVESIKEQEKVSLQDIYQKLKLMNNIEFYNLLNIYDLSLNLELVNDNNSIILDNIYKDRILDTESIDFIIDTLKRNYLQRMIT